MGDTNGNGRFVSLRDEPVDVRNLLTTARARFVQYDDSRQHYVDIRPEGIAWTHEFDALKGTGTLYGAAVLYHKLSEHLKPVVLRDEGSGGELWEGYKQFAADNSTRLRDLGLSQA